MKIKRYNLQPEFGTNTYLIWDEDSSEAVLIDAAGSSSTLIDDIKSLDLDLKYLFLTHGHSDHIGGISNISCASFAGKWAAHLQR